MITAKSHLELIRIINRIIELQNKDQNRFYSFIFSAGVVSISRCDCRTVLNSERCECVEPDDAGEIDTLCAILERWEADVDG